VTPAIAIVVAVAACSHGAADGRDITESSQRAAPTTGTDDCGRPGQADCPLQGWMKANMTPALTVGDAPRLQRAFTRLADLAPTGYDGWRPAASRGADAASRGDFEAARRACKQCHEDSRTRYRASVNVRSRPLP